MGDLPPDGPQNLLDNKLQMTFKIVGTKDAASIDPRAGRLEYQQTIRNQSGRTKTELTPFSICDSELVGSKVDFIKTDRLNDLALSYCLPADAYV